MAAVLSLSIQPHPARHRQLDAPGSSSHMPGFHLTCSEDSRPSPLHVPLQNRASHSHVLAHRAQEPSAAYAHSTAGSLLHYRIVRPPPCCSFLERTDFRDAGQHLAPLPRCDPGIEYSLYPLRKEVGMLHVTTANDPVFLPRLFGILFLFHIILPFITLPYYSCTTEQIFFTLNKTKISLKTNHC